MNADGQSNEGGNANHQSSGGRAPGSSASPVRASSSSRSSHATLSQVVADLQSRLKKTFQPALNRQHGQYDSTLIHPLSIHVSGDEGARGGTTSTDAGTANANATATGDPSFSLPLPVLSYSLQHFENQVLNAGIEGNSSSTITHNEKHRLLALYKELSPLSLQTFATTEGRALSQQILDRRKEYTTKYPLPVASSRRSHTTIQDTVELLAKECGWEVFPGADDDMGDEGGLAAEEDTSTRMTMMEIDSPTKGASSSSAAVRIRAKKTTLTVAGKGIVIDIDIEQELSALPPAPANSSDESGAVLPAATTSGNKDPLPAAERISAVRFSYGLEGSTDPGIDKMLLRLAKNESWEELRDAFTALATLDALVENPADSQLETASPAKMVDPFGAMKTLALKVEQIFKAELEVVASPAELLTKGHGLSIIYHTRPYLTLLLWVPADPLLSEEWSETISSGFQDEQMERVRRLAGVRSISFQVESSESHQHLASSTLLKDGPTFDLLPSAPEGLNVALDNSMRYLAILDEPIFVTQGAARKVHETVNGQDGTASDPPVYLQPQYMANVPSMTFENYLLAQTPFFCGLTQQKVLAGDEDDRADGSAISSLRLMHNTIPPASSSTAIQLERIPFRTVAQLLKVTEILRLQFLYTELVTNTFSGSALINAEDSTGEAQITLNDLFSDTASDTVSLTVESDLASFPPVITGAITLPYLPNWLTVTLEFRIVPALAEASGYAFSYTIEAPPSYKEVSTEVKAVLASSNGQDKMQAVLGISRDLTQLIQWISRRLHKHEKELWQAIASRPEWVR